MQLFADAESAEDQVQNIVGGGGAGNFVESVQRVVEIEKQHLVRDLVGDGGFRRRKRRQRIAYQLLVTGVGEETTFHLQTAVSSDVAQDLRAQCVDSLACHRRRSDGW